MNNTSWRKSSFSGNQGDCVEMANSLDRLRDSKNPNGPVLTANMGGLLAAVKQGQFGQLTR